LFDVTLFFDSFFPLSFFFGPVVDRIGEAGRGADGSVGLYRHKATNQYFVLKRSPLDSSKQFTLKQQKEYDFLSRANSEFVPKCVGQFKDDLYGYLALEYCSGGDLRNEMARRKRSGHVFNEEVSDCHPFSHSLVFSALGMPGHFNLYLTCA
jgi:serine/threonine protein kinase